MESRLLLLLWTNCFSQKFSFYQIECTWIIRQSPNQAPNCGGSKRQYKKMGNQSSTNSMLIKQLSWAVSRQLSNFYYAIHWTALSLWDWMPWDWKPFHFSVFSSTMTWMIMIYLYLTFNVRLKRIDSRFILIKSYWRMTCMNRLHSFRKRTEKFKSFSHFFRIDKHIKVLIQLFWQLWIVIF